MQDILIIGNGGFAREVLEYYRITSCSRDPFGKDHVFFADETNEKEMLAKLEKCVFSKLINGIGDQKRKRILANFVAKTEKSDWLNILACEYFASRSENYGAGNIFAPVSVISVNTKIGDFCLFNYGSTVGHDCVIGDYVTVSPNASVGGWCVLEDECYIGAGANILPKVRIGKKAIIGAGAVVTKDVPDGVVAKGVPARWGWGN